MLLPARLEPAPAQPATRMQRPRELNGKRAWLVTAMAATEWECDAGRRRCRTDMLATSRCRPDRPAAPRLRGAGVLFPSARPARRPGPVDGPPTGPPPARP